MPFTLKKTGSWSYFGLSDLDGAGIIHGFCTISTPPPPWNSSARQDFLSTFSLLDCVTMAQEHRDEVHVIGEGTPAPQTGDGLVLLKKGVAGIIRTADCVPIILWEPQAGIGAIVHAGWRGTVLGIAGKAADLMVDLGAEPSLMQALIGPCIGPCCYEVKEDVLHRFQEAEFGREAFHHRRGALFLDLRQANTEDLQDRGVCGIHVLDLCTRCREDLFYSARRNDTGRQMSFVALTV